MDRTPKTGLCLALASAMVLTGVLATPSFAQQQDASDLSLSTWTRDQRRDDDRARRHNDNKGPKRRCPRKTGRQFASTVVDPTMKDAPAGIYETITEAYRHTKVGGSIYIRPGLYRESLCIEYSAIFRGDTRARDELSLDRDRVIIEPPATGRPQSCAVINYPDIQVTFRGLDFRSAPGNDSKPCIQHRKGHLIMQDSSVQGTLETAALELAGGTSTIDRNRFTQSNYGIYVTGSYGEHHIRDNGLMDNNTGIYIDGGRHTQLYLNNASYNSMHGIMIAKGEVDVEENDLEYNGYAGIAILPERGVRLTENFIGNNERYGMQIPFPTFAYFSKNYIGCSGEAAILYTNKTDNEGKIEQFSDNIFEYNPRPEDKKRGWFSRLRGRDRNPCLDYSRELAGVSQLSEREREERRRRRRRD